MTSKNEDHQVKKIALNMEMGELHHPKKKKNTIKMREEQPK